MSHYIFRKLSCEITAQLKKTKESFREDSCSVCLQCLSNLQNHSQEIYQIIQLRY